LNLNHEEKNNIYEGIPAINNPAGFITGLNIVQYPQVAAETSNITQPLSQSPLQRQKRLQLEAVKHRPLIVDASEIPEGSDQASIIPPPPPPPPPSPQQKKPMQLENFKHSLLISGPSEIPEGSDRAVILPPPPPALPKSLNQPLNFRKTQGILTTKMFSIRNKILDARPKNKLKQMHWDRLDTDVEYTVWAKMKLDTDKISKILKEKGILDDIDRHFAAQEAKLKTKKNSE
jgi:hypothetical protein